jgi:excisionase family DNA binding protein
MEKEVVPRTKPKPIHEPAPQPGPNGPTDNVLTLGEAAAYLRLPENDVLHMVHEQGLHGRQVGTEWRFLRSAIDDWLRTGPQPLANKEAWLALAGAWKDDPTVDDLLQEMQKWRRQLDAEVNG